MSADLPPALMAKKPETAPPALARNISIGAVLFLAYLAILLPLIGARPLWIDELIQLRGTSSATWHGLVQHMYENAGGTPLGYLGQYWLISVAGRSIWTARLLSLFAGAGSLALLALIGKQLGFRRFTILLGVSLWAICPLAVRYSLEGRPYMQALFFSLGAVAAQLEFTKTRQMRWAVVLAGCLGAAVYSQPFAVFAPLGFSIWHLWQTREFKPAAFTFGAYALAGLSFLPWLVAAHSHWREAIARSEGGFAWTPSLALLILRECVGDGYPAAIPAVVLAAVAAARYRSRGRLPLSGAVLATLLLAVAADAKFNYFFAIRQVIYMVPFLLLLTAEGAATLWAKPRYRAAVAVLASVFVVAALAKNYRHLTDRSEDWTRLSTRLSAAAQDGCVLIPERDGSEGEKGIYAMLEPRIPSQLCDPGLTARRVVVPLHRYTDPRAARSAESALAAAGMTRLSTERAGFAKIEVFTKAETAASPALKTGS